MTIFAGDIWFLRVGNLGLIRSIWNRHDFPKIYDISTGTENFTLFCSSYYFLLAKLQVPYDPLKS